MSFECMDKGVIKKIKDVYPNVVFGPLARALQNSAMSETDYQDINGLVQHSDPYDYVVKPNTPTNPIATQGTAPHDFGEKGDPSTSYPGTSKNLAVAFPLVAIDRVSSGFDLQGAANDPYIRRGWRVYSDRDIHSDPLEKPTLRERAFPVSPIYQIDIISNRRIEVDELWREITMYLYLDANISVVYSEGTDEEFEEKYPLIMLETDTLTDVETFENQGIIYRQTITAQLRDAKMVFQKHTPLIEVIPIHVEPMGDDWVVGNKDLLKDFKPPWGNK